MIRPLRSKSRYNSNQNSTDLEDRGLRFRWKLVVPNQLVFPFPDILQQSNLSTRTLQQANPGTGQHGPIEALGHLIRLHHRSVALLFWTHQPIHMPLQARFTAGSLGMDPCLHTSVDDLPATRSLRAASAADKSSARGERQQWTFTYPSDFPDDSRRCLKEHWSGILDIDRGFRWSYEHRLTQY
ncbi:hypothetical protein N657DRAFT_505018 [Parathielavia appendiculata]|uniref:Uncharacterized protein n=1 Tax=Parathielavia appendiculata TaxID=2587402 RepID=A0AAN6TX76_9PEZI|nr:hypothetical protein N657DRAFT_505018 [Parathielavia appendiculata]